MMRRILGILFVIVAIHSVYAQEIAVTSELPHFYYEHNGSITVRWIEDGQGKRLNDSDQHLVYEKQMSLFSKLLGVDVPDVLRAAKKDSVVNHLQQYPDVEKFLAVSDLHGQHALFVELLRNHGVLDTALNWSFGQGHLVIVGDIMDRGDQVTESLWLLTKLERQATAIGGKVHYIIGNHELMVFDGDLRYINKKYDTIARVFETSYDQLFAHDTFFGRWLKRKPVMIQINNILFTHGGISVPFVEKGYTIENANRLFVDSVFTQTRPQYLQEEKLAFLTRSLGPLWYRGYFKGDEFGVEDLDKVLKGMDVQHIIVGHTSHPTIVTLFENRIFGIDASIKKGERGEVLFYEKGIFYRGLKNGDKKRF